MHKEMDASKVCVTCTQNCMLLHGKKKDASSVDKSFVKILFGDYEFSKFLYLPPKVSQTIPVLGVGQPHVLEDSNGRRWPVTLGNSNGAMAFQKGWEQFYSDHGLKEGYILHFTYLQSHFLVKIYDTTCTPKLNFSKENDNKSERSNGNESADELGSQKISDEFTNKQVSTTSIASGSECKTQGQQMINDRPSRSSFISVAANRMHSQLMNFDSRNGDGSGSSVISRAVKLEAHGRMYSQPRQCLPPLVIKPDNLPRPENEDGSQLMIKDKPLGSSVISGSDNRIRSQPMTMYKPPSSEDGDGGRKLPLTTLVKFRGEKGKESQVMTKDKPPSTSVRASTGDRTQWQQTSKEKPSGSQNGNDIFKPHSTTTVREENRRENQVMSKEKTTSTSVILRPSDRVQSQPMSKDKTLNSENGNSGFKLPSTISLVSRAENRGEIKGMTKDKPVSTSVISEVGDRTQSKLMLKDKPLSLENGNSGSQLSLFDGYDTVQISGRYAEYKYEENRTHYPSSFEEQGRVDADGSIDRRTHPSNILVEAKTRASILNKKPASKKVPSGEPPAEVSNFKAFSNSSIGDTSMRKNVAVVENDHDVHLSGLPLKKRILLQKEDTTKSSMKSKTVKCQETAGRNKQSGELMKIPEKESMELGKDNEVCIVMKTEPVESFDRACLGTSGDTCKAVVERTEWLELQKSLPSITFRKRADRRVVGLRGPDNRVWPVLYVETGGVKALLSGWKNFYYSNGLREGDECTFIPEEMPNVPTFNNEPFYTVNIVRK